MINRFASRLARWVLARRVPIIVFYGLLAVPAVVLLFSIRIDNSADIWFHKDSPHFVRYERFLTEFGSDRIFIVAYEHDDLFGTEALIALKGACEEIRNLHGVERVVSLFDAPVVDWTPMGPSVRPFLETIPKDSRALDRARERALSTPLFRGNLISEDGRTLFLFASVETLTLREKEVLVREVEEVVARLSKTGGRVDLAGMPFIEVEFDRLTRRENAIFIPLSMTVIVMVLLGLFRSVRVTAWAVPALMLAIAVTLSTFTAMEYAFNLMTSLVPPLLLSIGVANVVHILVHYREELGRGLGREEALRLSIERMFRPCFFTSITTAAGFFSLNLADIPPVQQAGLFGGAGILLAFVISFTLFPAGLSYFSADRIRRGGEDPGRLGSIIPGILKGAHHVASRRRWSVLAVSGFLLLGAVTGIVQVRPETNVIRFFHASNPVRVGWTALEERGVAITAIEVLFEGEPGAFLDATKLARIREAGRRLARRKEVTRCFCAAHLLDHAARGLGSKEEDRLKAWQGLLPLLASARNGERRVLREYVNEDASKTRLSARTIDRGTHDRSLLVRWVRETLLSEFPDLAPFEINGTAQLFAALDEAILDSQKRMAMVAGVAIFLITVVLLRSFLNASLAMVPNVAPIVVTLGLMGWTGIPLDVGTMIIAGVAVGIAVDDTIHYLTRFAREREAGKSVPEACRTAHRTVGRAIVFTSIVLFMGFGVIGLSSFRPIYTFGLLTGLTMVLALLGDLLLLPAMLLLFRREKATRS